MEVFSGTVLTACFVFASLSGFGQQGAVRFKHFRVYSPGQWTQEMQAYRDGVALGPVQRSTTCTSPLGAPQAAAVIRMGNDAAPMCRMNVIKDEESIAEYEQVCNSGPQEQTIHSTMRAIDDHTMTVEIRHTVAGHEMSFSRITSRYEGTCTTAAAAPAMPAMPKPSAEQCAEVPGMKKQVEETSKRCVAEDMPEAERVSCVAAMKTLASHVQQMEAQCK